MMMLVEIRRNEIDQLLYSAPIDFASDKKGNFYVIFRSLEKCTYLQIDKKQELANRITLNFNNSVFSQHYITSVTFDKKVYDTDMEDINLIVGFKTGCICKLKVQDQKHLGYWNVNKFKNGPITNMICHNLILVEELDIFIAQFEMLMVEYEYALEREGKDDDYEIIHNMSDGELFVDDECYTKLKEVLGQSDYKNGFVNVKDKSELSYCWVNFREKPYLSNDKENKLPHKMIAAWRFNIGHITDIKVYYVYEDIDKKESEGMTFLSKVPLMDYHDQEKRVKDVYACMTGNDGYFRVFSLIKNEYVTVVYYMDGGINNMDLSFDRSHAIFSLQNDSIMLVNLLKNQAIIFELHENFVSHTSFLHQVNIDLKAENDPDWNKVFRILSASLDGSVSILDYKRGSFLKEKGNEIKKTKLDGTIQFFDDSKKDNLKQFSFDLLGLDSMIIDVMDPDKRNDNKKIYFKKRDMKNLKFGTSGAALYKNAFGINSPIGLINIFYFKTSLELRKSIMKSGA